MSNRKMFYADEAANRLETSLADVEAIFDAMHFLWNESPVSEGCSAQHGAMSVLFEVLEMHLKGLHMHMAAVCYPGSNENESKSKKAYERLRSLDSVLE